MKRFCKALSIVLVVITLASIFVTSVSAATLKKGSSGTQVKYLQMNLNGLGYSCGKADGKYGNNTYNAVKSFQRDNNLTVDGIVGNQTQAKIKEIVKAVQNLLNSLGYDAGTADGIFGSKTTSAIKKFQGDYRLSKTGIADSKTIDKIAEAIIAKNQQKNKTSTYKNYISSVKNFFSDLWSGLTTSGKVTVLTSEPIQMKLSKVSGVAQIKNHCTTCATATMLRRKQALDNKNVTFTYNDVRVSKGAPKENPKKDIPGPTWVGTQYYTDSDSTAKTSKQTTYVTNAKYKYQLGKTADEIKASIIKLLKEHPEGIVFYGKHLGGGEGVHAIVISRYDPVKDKFYAYDPMGNNETPKVDETEEMLLEQTRMFDVCENNIDWMFEHVIYVWFVVK